MNVTCPTCKTEYDDAERLTYCPHDLLYPPEILKQKDLALSLVGKRVRFRHQTDYEARFVTTVLHDGMIVVEGLTGEFAPHLFVVVE
jgi:hypothetical protein